MAILLPKLVKLIKSNPLLSGSMIMVIGSNAANFLSLVYTLMMGKLLGPASYGELVALFSLLGLISILPLSFGVVIVKYISAAKNDQVVKGLVGWFYRFELIIGSVYLILFLVSSIALSNFLQIYNPWLVVLTVVTFFFSLFSFLNKSVLQGVLKFRQMVTVTLLEVGLKLILGIGLVYLGFSVFGAMVGVAIASTVGFLISWYFIKDYIGEVRKLSTSLKAVLRYALPVLALSAAITSLYTADLILVKHFFSPVEAGLYSATATLGKITFFATTPITAVMFPLVSKRQSRGENYQSLFNLGLLLTFLAGIVVTAIFYLFGTQVLNMVYGPKFVLAASWLFEYGLFIAIFAISNLIVNYHLSLGDTRVVIFPLVAALAQIGLIMIYHIEVIQVISILIMVTLLLLITMSVYSRYRFRMDVRG